MGITFNSTPYTLASSFYLNSSLWTTLKAAEKLSSGLRINTASDDPAGLVISEQLRSSIATLNAEINNLSMNIGRYQYASSTVQSIRSSLTELRALAVGAANEGGNSESAQQAYVDAANAIVNTYNDSIANAEYNGGKLLDGSDRSLADLDRLDGIDLSTAEGATQALEQIDSAAAQLDSTLVDIGATQRYELEARLDNLQVTRQNLIAAESQVRDVSFVHEYANFVLSQIKTRTSIAMMAHTNIMSSSILDLLRSD